MNDDGLDFFRGVISVCVIYLVITVLVVVGVQIYKRVNHKPVQHEIVIQGVR